MKKKTDKVLFLVFQPPIAVALGLNDAIILHQVHYWMARSNNIIDGRTWVYNSYSEWQVQFPFLSAIVIKRAIRRLEKKGLLLSAVHNDDKRDRTKWYSLDYEALGRFASEAFPPIELEPSIIKAINNGRLVQSNNGEAPSCDEGRGAKCPSPLLAEITSENTSETTTDMKKLSDGSSSLTLIKDVQKPSVAVTQQPLSKKELAEKYRSRWNRFVTYANEERGSNLRQANVVGNGLIESVWETHYSDGFDFNAICNKIIRSNFLLGFVDAPEEGPGENWNGASFSFVFNKKQFWVKILNGDYDNRGSNTGYVRPKEEPSPLDKLTPELAVSIVNMLSPVQ